MSFDSYIREIVSKLSNPVGLPDTPPWYSVLHVNACVCFGFTRGQLGMEKDRRGDGIKPRGDRSEERKKSLKELY